MGDNRLDEYRWGIGNEERAASDIRVSYRGETRWDRAVPRVAAVLMYGVGVLLTGEHVWNFFKNYGELATRSYRNTGERYGATLFMFLFAALIPVTIAAMRGNVAANVAVLTYAVARLFENLAANVSLANLIEFVVVCMAFGAFCQRAVETQGMDTAALGRRVERLQADVSALKQAERRR